MATTQYKCLNFASCDKALRHEVIEIEDGEEPVCPEPGCQSKLVPLKRKTTPGTPKWIIPAMILFCVAGLAIWLLTKSPKPKQTPPTAFNKVTSPANPPPLSPATGPPQSCADTDLAASLKDRFAKDDDLKVYDIQVDVTNKTVILSGSVSSDLERTRATEIVQSSGCPVVSLVNDLAIGTPDDALTALIKKAYASDPNLRSQPIKVEVSHGNVVLSGSVSEHIMRTIAASKAAEVHGVTTVTNNIQVVPVSKPSKTGSGNAGLTPTQPPTPSQTHPATLSGSWTGTYLNCAQAEISVRFNITESAPDDITADVEIQVPNARAGTFTTHGVLNTVNNFLSFQFSGWEYQPPGLAMGNIGGYVTFTDQGPTNYDGIIRSPGCGRISLRKQ